MSIITEAIRKLHFDIPEEILEEAFIDSKYYRSNNIINIDAIIREKVINPRVLVDTNMVSGREIVIPLDGLQYSTLDTFNLIIRIPKKLTQGSTIAQILDVSMGNMYGLTVGMIQTTPQSPYLQASNKLVDSATPVPIVSNSNIEIIGENVIMLKGFTSLPPYLQLRCMIEHDSEMSNISPRYFEAFYDLVLFAVKNYCYMRLAIKIGQARLSGGRELGVFKDILDTYSDAGENYRSHLKEVWQKVSMLADPLTRQRYHKLIAAI